MKRSSSVKQAKRPTHRSGIRVSSIAGIAILALVTAGLSGYAVFGAQDVAPMEPMQTKPATPPVADPSETTTTVPAPTESASVPIPQRLLAAGEEAGNLIRASRGGCGELPGTLETTFDSGESWTLATFGSSSVTELRQVDISNSAVLNLVALDDACNPLTMRSFGGGIEWSPSEDAAPPFLSQVPGVIVETTAGQVNLPCTAVSLSAYGPRAIALCDDASVTLSQDSGASWSETTAVSNAVAVGTTPTDFVVASHNTEDCTGIQVRLVSTDMVGEPGGCLIGANAVDGSIAVSGNSTSVFLWAGDQFAISPDSGISWG